MDKIKGKKPFNIEVIWIFLYLLKAKKNDLSDWSK